MEKITARFFYSPICPEAFATMERLGNFFSHYGDRVNYQGFNIMEEELFLKQDWFPEEQEILECAKGVGTKPLLYGQLFVDGKRIKGFPPSKKDLREVLATYGIDSLEEEYDYDYKTKRQEKRELSLEQISIKKYSKEILRDPCLMCTKYNPYLEESQYSEDQWKNYENMKGEFLRKALGQDELLGFVVYHGEEPAGFAEAFPLEISRKLGFPVSETSRNGIMITCLSVRGEMSGYGIASGLIEAMEREAKNKGYKTIEVLAFQDHHNWQPKSLYAKGGYKEVLDVDGMVIMKKLL